MEGFKLRPAAARARRRPWQRRRRWVGYTAAPAYIGGSSTAVAFGALAVDAVAARVASLAPLDVNELVVQVDVASALVALDVTTPVVQLDVEYASVALDTV